MKKQLMFLLGLCCWVAGVFFACQKGEEQPAISGQVQQKFDFRNKLSVENGMLVFSTAEDFSSAYFYFMDNQNELENLKKAFPTFISMQEAYFKNIENVDIQVDPVRDYPEIAYWRGEGTEKTLEIAIDNPVYASLYNDKGLLKVENTILHRTSRQIESFDSEGYFDGRPNLRKTISLRTADNNRFGTC